LNDRNPFSSVHVKVVYQHKEGYFAKVGVTHFSKETFDGLFVAIVSLNLFLHVDKKSNHGVNTSRDWVIRDCHRNEVGRIRFATQSSEITMPVYKNDVLMFQEVIREVVRRPMTFNANVELLSKQIPHVIVSGFRSRHSPSELHEPAPHLPPPPHLYQPLYQHHSNIVFPRNFMLSPPNLMNVPYGFWPMSPSPIITNNDFFFSDGKLVYPHLAQSVSQAENAAMDIPVPIPFPVQSQPLGKINTFNYDNSDTLYENFGRECAETRQELEANELIDLLVSGSKSLW
jgi:hypothetical protein